MEVTDQVRVPTILAHGKAPDTTAQETSSETGSFRAEKNILPNTENLAAF